MEELETWFNEHGEIPENEDTAFIAKHYINALRGKPNPQKLEEDVIEFRCFLTAKRLIKNSLNKDILHADGTYKLNWNGFPLTVFGSTDKKGISI